MEYKETLRQRREQYGARIWETPEQREQKRARRT